MENSPGALAGSGQPSSAAVGEIRGRLRCNVGLRVCLEKSFRVLTLVHRILSGSSLSISPSHITLPTRTLSHSSFKGPFSFLPMVLCTCCFICLKCSSPTSFIGPHAAQMFLLQGSSELPSRLGSLFCVSLPHCPYSLCFAVWLYATWGQGPCLPCSLPGASTRHSTQHIYEAQEASLTDLN